jgi:serine/threonine-protein kinase
MAEVNGTPFGRYRLVELLGRGGMGEVWRAHDTGTDRIVAIKLLPANFSENEEFKQRFRREAHAAARLNTPHVIPIYDYGEIDGRLYVCMRLMEGRDLQTLLADGPLEPSRAVRIIEQVALALHAAHKVGLLHRDVKPSNILLDDDDFAYLIDFGIARAADETRLTKTGNTIGTFHYVAPERLSGELGEDARADIYALACVLYECLTGRTPFAGDDMARLVAAHLNTPPPQPSKVKPDVPLQLDEVIATGMAKDPDQRYATTVELARAARDATTVPLASPGPSGSGHQPSQPTLRAAAPIHGQDTQLAATGAAPVLPPAPASPTQNRGVGDTATRCRFRSRGNRGARRGGCVRGRQGLAAAQPPADHRGSVTGIYRADYGPATDRDGKPVEGATPSTITWGVRSVCRPSGCVATAARLSGETGCRRGCSTMLAGAGWPWVSAQIRARTLRPKPGWWSRCNHAPTASSSANPAQPPAAKSAQQPSKP